MCINSFCSFTSADGIDFEFYSLRIHVLLKRTEELLKDLENGRVGIVVLMDLSKTFDCIPHHLFLYFL